MDEQELEKQFEATDYDEKGNIKQTPPPPAAAKKKRVTMADLKKQIEELEELVEVDAYTWLDKIDSRIRHIEQMGLENLPSFISDTNKRLDKIEHELKPQSEQGAKFVWDRLDNQDVAIGALVNALRQHLEEAAAAPPETKPEIEFAQPPAHPEPVTATKGDIEAVASVCQSLADVLMICRALKADHDLSDEDRLYILQVACRMAGELITNGLKIRAGIKYVGA